MYWVYNEIYIMKNIYKGIDSVLIDNILNYNFYLISNH